MPWSPHRLRDIARRIMEAFIESRISSIVSNTICPSYLHLGSSKTQGLDRRLKVPDRFYRGGLIHGSLISKFQEAFKKLYSCVSMLEPPSLLCCLGRTRIFGKTSVSHNHLSVHIDVRSFLLASIDTSVVWAHFVLVFSDELRLDLELSLLFKPLTLGG